MSDNCAICDALPDDLSTLDSYAANGAVLETGDIGGQRPIIPIESKATCVQPKLTCRVGFDQRTKSGRLSDIEWNKLLGSIEKR